MSRVDELQKRYPSIPREIIVWFETSNFGIRDSEVIDKTSSWFRSQGYLTHDHDLTLKDIAAKRPGTLRPGFIMRPTPFRMRRGVAGMIYRDSKSPYEFKELGDGRYTLFEGAEKVEDVWFPLPRPWTDREPVTTRGTPVTALVSVNRRCFVVRPVRYCQYFKTGDQCRFCNYNSTYNDARSVGLNPVITLDLEETVEAYKILSAARPRWVEGTLQSGGIGTSEQEAQLYIKFVEGIATGASYIPNLKISCQPVSRRNLQRLKDAGLASLLHQPEAWEAHLFAQVCPGKYKRDGWEGYLEAFLNAVDILGVGSVGNVFVAGATLMAPNGHETWQEARDSMIEGFRWSIKNGIWPCFTPLRLGVGSIYGDDKSSSGKLPPTEFYLELALAHHELMLEYSLYDKVDKLLYCPLEGGIGYSGHIGYLALAGDVGQWAAQAVPSDANWVAKFTSSVKSQIEV